MKTKFLVVLTLFLFAAYDVGEAGWRGRGWHGAGWRGGVAWRGPAWGWRGGVAWRGPGWGWRGPGWGWRGGWGWGPGIGVGIRAPGVGVGIVAPLSVYGGVYASPRYVAYSAPTLYRAQLRLAELGYEPGPLDGAFGPMTSRAIRNYQIDNGLPVTGRLDNRTRASLGV